MERARAHTPLWEESYEVAIVINFGRVIAILRERAVQQHVNSVQTRQIMSMFSMIDT